MLDKTKPVSQKDGRRQQLIDGTVRAISKYGLSGTTVQKVATEAGLSVGTIGFYFDGKEKLLLGTLEYLSREFREILETAIATPANPMGRLQAIINAYFFSEISDPDKIAVWWAFCSESNARKDYMAICGDQDRWFRESLHTLIREEYSIRNSSMADSHILAVTRGLEGIIDGFWQECLYEPNTFNPDQAAAVCRDYLDTIFPGSNTCASPDTATLETPVTEYTEHMPRWAYHDEELFELEKEELFRKNWLLVGHVNDMPEPRDYLTLDAVGERAIVIRDNDGTIRAFHNVCQHRGAKLKDSLSGQCEHALMCPFHGWTYQLNGNLIGVPAENTFKNLDKSRHGLVPLDMEIWMGFVFVRFKGDGPSVSEQMKPVEDVFAAYRIEEMLPLQGTKFHDLRPYNWKIIHDIDNEGYHVPIGHPALQQLYGKDYRDLQVGDVPMSVAKFNDTPGKLWSVRSYRNILPEYDHLPDEYQNLWQYGFTFPSMIFGLYPDSIEFYMTIPVALDKTIYRGARFGLPDDRRETRAARYLCHRINSETEREDESFVRWMQDGMGSSAFPEPRLSSIESGVQRYHNSLQKILPVTRLKEHPGRGRVADVNREMQAVN